MSLVQQRLLQRLDERRDQHQFRQRLTLDSAQGGRIQLADQTLLCFCSNDYLGLANHPKLIESLKAAADKYGVGSGASHLVVGHSRPHHELEEALAEFTGRSRAVLFGSGYMANLGTLAALLQRGDFVFEDRLNHASLLDGGLHSGAKFKRFPHNDADSLAVELGKVPAEAGKLVVVDGIYSMDGDAAPLQTLAKLCKDHEALLMVDDAHGLGVMGPGGAGSVAAAGLDQAQVPVLMGTLGKALGCAGAFVAGDEPLVEALIQFARTYIYTTAIPPAVAAATITALGLLKEEHWRQEHLAALIKRFRQGAEQLSLPLMESDSAVQPLLLGDEKKALAVSEALKQRGILVSAIRPPTVPAGTARLRITLSAAHSEEEVDELLAALDSVAR